MSTWEEFASFFWFGSQTLELGWRTLNADWSLYA